MSLNPKEQSRVGVIIIILVLAILIAVPIVSAQRERAACQDFNDNYRSHVLGEISHAEKLEEAYFNLWKRYNTSASYDEYLSRRADLAEWRNVLAEVDKVGVATYTSIHRPCN
jgi:hypothetical protein